jgi:hypothetical protein
MAEIVLDSAGGQTGQAFRRTVAHLLAHLYAKATGRAVLDSIGAFRPGYPAMIVIRRSSPAPAASAPIPPNASLDQLLQPSQGGSGLGHAIIQRELRSIDTSTAEERAWEASRRGTAAPAQHPTVGRIRSHAVPLNFDVAARWPEGEMLHELVHALRELQGHARTAARRPGPPGYSNHEEFSATTVENVLRSELARELRKGYAGVDPVFRRIERRASNRVGAPLGSLTDEFSPFPVRPTDEELEWGCERLVEAHGDPLRTFRSESPDLFARVAAIPENGVLFNPFRVFTTRRGRRPRSRASAGG